jgi:hypothetical protein
MSRSGDDSIEPSCCALILDHSPQAVRAWCCKGFGTERKNRAQSIIALARNHEDVGMRRLFTVRLSSHQPELRNQADEHRLIAPDLTCAAAGGHPSIKPDSACAAEDGHPSIKPDFCAPY